jgi:hypothetical protein
LRGYAEQRSERDGGKCVSLEHAAMVGRARGHVIARTRRRA